MRLFIKICAIGAAIVSVAGPVPAFADGYFTPWIGANIVDSRDEGSRAYGVTTGYMGGGVFGFEGDFSYAPDFLGTSTVFRSTSAITGTGDVILGVPIGGTHGASVRPFVTGGLGLIRTHSESEGVLDLSNATNSFCYELGGGMMGFFSQHFGVRGDVRYVRTLRDEDLFSGVDLTAGRLKFWRVSGGVTFR
jgi:hypothetical protein